MNTTKLSVDEFAAEVREITDLGVAEIIKYNERSYTFRVSTIWYEVSYLNEMGMYLKLLKGESSTTTIDLICSSIWLPNGSELRKQGDSFFDILERIYVSHLVFKNEKLSNALKNYIVLISKCTSIEKLAENVFTIIVNNIKYIFERNDKYYIECKYVFPILDIKYIADNELKVKRIEEYKKIESIFSVLNAIYFLNKTEENGLIEDDILSLFN